MIIIYDYKMYRKRIKDKQSYINGKIFYSLGNDNTGNFRMEILVSYFFIEEMIFR